MEDSRIYTRVQDFNPSAEARAKAVTLWALLENNSELSRLIDSTFGIGVASDLIKMAEFAQSTK